MMTPRAKARRRVSKARTKGLIPLSSPHKQGEVTLADDRYSARKGKAIEHLVAATCVLASGLKLNVSTSLVDDEGVDLVFHRREDTTTLAVQVKGRLLTAKTIEKRARFQQSVRAATFRPRPNLVLLFVVVDAKEGTFPFVWFIPSEEFLLRFRGPNGNGNYAFVASTKEDSRDRWSEYKCLRADLPKRILSTLDRLANYKTIGA